MEATIEGFRILDAALLELCCRKDNVYKQVLRGQVDKNQSERLSTP